MVLGSSATVSIRAMALLAAVPGDGVSAPGIADFLATIGSETDMKTSGSMLSDPSPQLYPLPRDDSEIIGYRFFAEKLTANGFATAERANSAFAQEYARKGDRSFHERVLGRRLPQPGSFKHFWSDLSAVCARGRSRVIGGLVAITFDSTELATKGDPGARLFSKISVMATRAAAAGERRANEAFRRNLAVGNETNCGTVIQLRGPMVEIAVPPVRLTPHGQSIFWSKRAVLARPGIAPCL